MMQLRKPAVTGEVAVNNCCAGMTGNSSLLENVKLAKKRFILNENAYELHAIHGDLYRIVSLPDPRKKCLALKLSIQAITNYYLNRFKQVNHMMNF